MSTFEGRTALITGGGTGMGRAFALALAERGAPVAVCGRRAEPIEETAELCRAHGVAALASQVDVRDPERVEAWVAEARRALGPPRMLINNAAGNFLAHAIDLSPNGWRAVIDIVLNGTFYCSTAVARSMREAGVGGSILNVIASYAWTGNPMTAHSAAAKAGVWNLARSLAVEWAPLGIRVNCIAPGRSTARAPQSGSSRRPRSARRCSTDIPARRFTTLEDVVASALFLLSDDAGSHHRRDAHGRRRAGARAGHVPPQPDCPAAVSDGWAWAAGARSRRSTGRIDGTCKRGGWILRGGGR